MMFRSNQRTLLWLLLVLSLLVVVSIHSCEAKTKSSKHSKEREKVEETTKSPDQGSGDDESNGAGKGSSDVEQDESSDENDDKDAKKSSKGSRASDSMKSSNDKEEDEEKGGKSDSEAGDADVKKSSNGSSRTSDSSGDSMDDKEKDSEEDGGAKKSSKGSRTTDSMDSDSDHKNKKKDDEESSEGKESSRDNGNEGNGGDKQKAGKGSRAGTVRYSKTKSISDLRESDIADEGDRKAILGRPGPQLTRGRSRTGFSGDSKHKGSKKGKKNNENEDSDKKESDDDEGKGSGADSQEDDLTSADKPRKKESEESGDKPSYRKAAGSRSSNGTKKSKSKKSNKKETEEGAADDESAQSGGDADGSSRISGGFAVTDSDPPGWITQVREDRSGTVAGGCEYAHLLGFALRLADEYLLMHDQTFVSMNRENELGGLGTRPGICCPGPTNWQPKGSHEFVMMPLQHPIPRKINVGALGKLGTNECMYKMGFRMSKWDQKEDNISIYRYQREGHVAAFQFEETFDYPMIEKDPEAPIYDCELLGWSEYVEGKENVEGTWDFEFVRLPLALDKCDKGQKHCEFKGRSKDYKAAICTNDIGLPIVCGKDDEKMVRFILGEPVPFGKCAEVPIRGYNVAHLLTTGAQGDVEWKNKDEVELMVTGTRRPKKKAGESG